MEIKNFLHLLRQKEAVSPLDISYFELLDQDSHPLVAILGLKEEAILVYLSELSKSSDSLRLKSCRRAERIAEYLLDAQGEIDQEKLARLLDLLTNSAITYLSSSDDQEIVEHIIPVLENLKAKGSLVRALKRFFLPLTHRGADRLIRNTVGLSEKEPITNRHLKKSVLSACLTLLKQSIGSCFATAPCILIHQEQQEIFVEDLYQLLMAGRLKRVFEGEEYSVPLSPSWGVGELKKRITPIKEVIEYSPALIAAFSAAGRFDFREKISTRDLIQHCLHAPEVIDCDNLIALVLKDEMASELAKAAFKRVVEHPLLKAWEYTIASFAEFKTDFSTWNLYVSLGLDPETSGGIGELLYREIDRYLQEATSKAAQFQKEYEESFHQVRMLEGLLKAAYNEEQIRRLRAEHQLFGYQLITALNNRDQCQKAAKHYSELLSILIDQYHKKFPLYFQEIYDAEILDLAGSIYDDKPAGFRLVYKHGRQDASVWTMVQNQKQYIECLVDFFQLTEGQIEATLEEDMQKEGFRKLTTQIILHLQTEEFSQSALLRIQEANPSDRYRLFRKPWCYISGGSMEHLLKIYFKREQEFTKESKSPQNAGDLLAFLIEMIKELPAHIYLGFTEKKFRSLLMHSPSHAFSLRPALPLFQQGWQDKGFTYTWVRDHLEFPAREFYEKITLSNKEQRMLVEEYAKTLPYHFAATFIKDFFPTELPAFIDEFRNALLVSLERAAHAHDIAARELFEESLDQFLYHSFPISTRKQVQLFLESEVDLEGEFFTSKMVLQIALLFSIQKQGSIILPKGEVESVVERGRNQGLFPPLPLIFADTNWPDFYFAALYCPGTKKVELFRTDIFGLYAIPMRNWDPFFKGDLSLLWTVYTHPGEYHLHYS